MTRATQPAPSLPHSVRDIIVVPQSFRDMPRWWRDGTQWLDALPQLVPRQMDLWNLRIDGDVMHGSNAVVVPVRQGDCPLALRMTPPNAAVAAEVAALQFWDGRGTVRLLDADVGAGATLLERLDGTFSTRSLPLGEAIPIVARLMRRLAVPAPSDVRATADVAAERVDNADDAWRRLGQPFPRRCARLIGLFLGG